MFEEHPTFRAPPDEAKIWRYMDISKFVSILENKCLYFTRSDRFKDQFEGSLPILSSINLHSFKAKMLQEVEEHNKKMFRHDRVLKMRTTTGLNCWHLNEYESAAMWNLYLKSNEGFAIQSTFSRLKESLKDTDERVFIGLVNYLDYNRDQIPLMDTFSPFLTKRISFSHEKELRALIWDGSTVNSENIEPIDESRLNVDVNTDILIEKVYLAPNSPDWIESLTRKLMGRYELSVEVVRSQLEEQPFF